MRQDDTGRGGDLLAVGKILRPHGIRGALVVEPLTDWPAERFAPGSRLLLEATPGGRREVAVTSRTPHKGRVLITLEGVSDRNEAEKLKGAFLMLPARLASRLGEGEYWVHDLVGIELHDPSGRALGAVEDVICREAQDLLVVREPGGREVGIPFVSQFVKSVNLDRRVMTVELPEGLM